MIIPTTRLGKLFVFHQPSWPKQVVWLNCVKESQMFWPKQVVWLNFVKESQMFWPQNFAFVKKRFENFSSVEDPTF